MRTRFGAVPRQVTVVYDWHSPQGRAFLDYVEWAVEEGEDINEIGSLIGVENFSQRYAILKKARERS